MEVKEENVRKFITSILTSSPLAVTMVQLDKDYRELIGQAIPYHKLGYNSLEHFLRSIPNTVRVRGSGSMAEILPVLSEKSSHVMEMVSSQKKPAQKRRGRYSSPRTIVMNPTVNQRRKHIELPTNTQTTPKLKATETDARIMYPSFHDTHKPTTQSFTSKPFIPKPVSHQTFTSQPVNPKPFTSQPVTTQPFNSQPITSQQFTSQPVTPQPFIPQQVTTQPCTSQPGTPEEGDGYKTSRTTRRLSYHAKENKEYMNSSSSSSRNRIKKLMEQSSSTQESSSNSHQSSDKEGAPGLSWKDYKCRGYKFNRVEPPTETAEDRVPIAIRNNLKQLVGMYPEGIWCAKLPKVYREMFRTELKYQDLGFTNLIDLCVSLESIFHYVRPSSDDFKLYDRSKPLPKCAEQKYTMASYSENNSTDVPLNCALPTIDWADMLSFIPPGTFHPGREIPRAFVPSTTAEGDCIDVVVGEIYDISKFWVYKDANELNKLMDEMQVFYGKNHLQYFMAKQLIREGVYCVQVIYGEYHRALIVDLTPLKDDMIRVIFIDYGTMAKVSIEGLCFLHEQFTKLPAQAIRCRLADIRPKVKGAPWSRESSKEFRSLIRKRTIVAEIDHINVKDQYLEVFLEDVTDKNNTFYINDRLVELGFAINSDDEPEDVIVDSLARPLVKNIHLYPSFAELEHGLSPSTTEMEVLFDCNIPINFCYPQYFYVDPTEEKKIIEQTMRFHENHCLKGVREFSRHTNHCIDRSKVLEEPLDFTFFGPLEEELRLFHATSVGEVPVEAPVEAGDASTTEEGSEQLEVLTSQTVEELRQDCLLSEAIINEILSICEVQKSASFSEAAGEVVVKVEVEVTAPEKVQEEVQVTPYVYNSNNPFLSDLADSSSEAISDVIPKLNPNNPFLVFLQNKEEDLTSNSSESTTYGACSDKQKWSTEDQVSDVPSLSSVSTVDVPATKTRDLARIAPPPAPFCSLYPLPYVYSDWSSLNNPYYTARLNFGYQQQNLYPQMMPRLGYGPHWSNQVYRPAVRPPPGFDQRVMGGLVQNPGLGQFNCVARANVNVRGVGADFYGVYNERLKLNLREKVIE